MEREFPKPQLGDGSDPTYPETPSVSLNTPNRSLGMLQFQPTQKRLTSLSLIPQTAVWGCVQILPTRQTESEFNLVKRAAEPTLIS